jgi:hypothetical protein
MLKSRLSLAGRVGVNGSDGGIDAAHADVEQENWRVGRRGETGKRKFSRRGKS